MPRAMIINQLNEVNLLDGANLRIEMLARIRIDEASA